MLTYNQSKEAVPSHIPLDAGCMDERAGSEDKCNSADIVFEIARQAVVQEDASQFLRKVAEILRGSADYDLVQIWTLESKQDHLSLSNCSLNTLRDLLANGTIPALSGACRRACPASDRESPVEKESVWGSAPIVKRLIIPLCLHGRLFGLLSIEDARPDIFSDECSAIMNRVNVLIDAAFDKFKAIAEARRSNEYLKGILNSAKDLAIIATDQLGYIAASSAGTEAIFQLPLPWILNRDIITLFTDEKFQQELMVYMGEGNASILYKNRLRQKTEKGTLFLDVTFQNLCCSESNRIGFLCFARDVTDNAILQQKLESDSTIDNLTGLFNRKHMINSLAFEIERCRCFNRSFSLCLMNLNNFRKYRDAQGILKSDETIKAVADLMRALTRTNVDTCYRYDSDEFAVLMPETSAHDATQSSERILRQLHNDFGGSITASNGIAEYSATFGPEDIIDKAVQAMHQAKASGGDCIVFAE